LLVFLSPIWLSSWPPDAIFHVFVIVAGEIRQFPYAPHRHLHNGVITTDKSSGVWCCREVSHVAYVPPRDTVTLFVHIFARSN